MKKYLAIIIAIGIVWYLSLQVFSAHRIMQDRLRRECADAWTVRQWESILAVTREGADVYVSHINNQLEESKKEEDRWRQNYLWCRKQVEEQNEENLLTE